ncbi:MAG: hypothetical protein ABW277_15350 [Longimicrobiaceae bacterium]
MSATLPLALGVTAAPAMVDAENPWPGLESFRERDQPFFRGRDAEADELARRVRRERLCILYGVSGLGKSSLLQAGLFPRVREHLFLPVVVRLAYHEGASPPRVQVLEALAAQAELHGVEAPPGDPGETLWEFFHREDHAFWTPDNQQAVPLLVFDQFEEAFTLGRATRGRELRTAAFLEELGDLIEGRPSRELKARLDSGEVSPRDFAFSRHSYNLLLVLREDFLAELETLAKTVPSVMTNRMRLAPLSGAAALRVTAAGGPALVPPAADPSAPGVGEQIVRLVAGDRGDDRAVPLDELVVDPALLSLFCRELNERRKALGRASITGDLVEGNREQILAEFYARSVADLDPGVRLLVEEDLLTVGGHRNSAALENALARPGVTAAAVDTLIERRLVRREERDRRSRIELTHDVLTGVVAQSRDQRRAEEEAAAATVRERERAEQLKAEAERLAREQRARTEAAVREAAAARRRSRWFAVAALGMLLLAGFAWQQRSSAKEQADSATKAKARADTAEMKANVALMAQNKAKDLADSVRDDAIESAAEADSARTRADAALKALTDTAVAMRAAQDSVRAEQLKAIVEKETADHYLHITGQLQGWQTLRDSALEATFRQRLDSLFQETEKVRAEFDSLRALSNQRTEVFESLLCGRVGAGQKTDTATVSATALRELRRRAVRELAARKEVFSCDPAPGESRTRPGGAKGDP